MIEFPGNPQAASDAPSAGGVVATEHGSVAIFKVGDNVYAVDDACVRCGSALSTGSQQGAEVTCPCCGWRYDVITGCARGLPELRLDTYDVMACGATLSIAGCGPRRPR